MRVVRNVHRCHCISNCKLFFFFFWFGNLAKTITINKIIVAMRNENDHWKRWLVITRTVTLLKILRLVFTVQYRYRQQHCQTTVTQA